MTLPVYSTGTVNVSNGGTVVTGTGCMWSGINAREGDYFTRADGMALITEVTDGTHLKITPWPGATIAGGPYAIEQNYVGRVVGVAAAEDVGVMLEKLHVDGLPFILGADETAPDRLHGDEGQPGVQAIDRAVVGDEQGGAWVPSARPDRARLWRHLGDLVLANREPARKCSPRKATLPITARGCGRRARQT